MNRLKQLTRHPLFSFVMLFILTLGMFAWFFVSVRAGALSEAAAILIFGSISIYLWCVR